MGRYTVGRPWTKISPEQATKIRCLAHPKDGSSAVDTVALAKRFGVTPAMIHRVLKGTCYPETEVLDVDSI